ncbi:MAG: hypothetical protein WD358_05785 [Nitriliruptoraceae bacterium]
MSDDSSAPRPPDGLDGRLSEDGASVGRHGSVGHVRRVRRWPWVLLALLSLAAAGVGGAIAWDQRQVAAEWRDVANQIEVQRDDALGRGEALQVQLDEIAFLLAASESDVVGLAERIRELADEKAQAEDTATTVQVERDVLAQVSNRIASAIQALDQCVDRMFTLQSSTVDAFNRMSAGEQVDVEPLNDQSQATTQFCNQARSAAAGAAAAAEQIRR